MDAGDVIVGLIVVIDEPTADENLAIRLKDHRVHKTISPATEVDGGIGCAVGIKTGEAGAGDAVELGEVPAYEQLSIHLPRNRIDSVIRAGNIVQKARVQRAIRI